MIGAFVLIAGEISGGKEDLLCDFDLRLNMRIIYKNKIGIQIFAIGDRFDGVNIGEQGFQHRPLEVAGFSHPFLIVRENPNPSLGDLYSSLKHRDEAPAVRMKAYFFRLPQNVLKPTLLHFEYVFA